MSAPTISRINPTSGPTSGGTTVIITGTNLASPSAVTFGASSATVVSSTATSISVTTPANAAGTVRVVVTTSAGTSTQAVNFTYVTVSAPTITSLSSTVGPASGGNTVTINGTNLLYTTSVSFGGNAASSFAILSNTEVSAVAPAGTPGATTVTVTNSAGTSGTLPYTYTGIATPSVSSVSPSSGPAVGGNTVSIGGSGFTYSTAVTFGSTAVTSFTVVSSSVISAVIPPGSSAGGAVSVLVTGPGGTSAAGTTYTYTAAPTPTITTLTPSSGSALGGNTVTITGSNFGSATAVTFAGTPATSFTVLSPTQVNAVAPAGTAGNAAVVVTTPAAASADFNYVYVVAPAPATVSPTAGVIAGNDSITITGTGLTGTTSVNFGNTPASSFTVVSDTELDAVTPAHLAGTVPINIATPGGTNGSVTFGYQPAPVISSISPTSGSTTGATAVNITGAGLIDALQVYFGTTPATSFTVNSDNSITATSPAGAAGVSAVTVSTDAATSNGGSFLYVNAPTLTSLSPTTGSIAGGNNVTLTGTGFSTATAVFFGPNPASFSFIDDTLISAVAPSGTGTVSVTVSNPGGTSGSQAYTYA